MKPHSIRPILMLCLMLATACAPAATPAQLTTPPQGPAETSAPNLPVALRVAAPQSLVDSGLMDAMNVAIANAQLADQVEIKLEAYKTMPMPIPSMCIVNPDLPYLFQDPLVDGAPPDLMLVESQSVYLLDPGRVSDAPNYASIDFIEPALNAFKLPDGRVVGLAQGTRVAMLVYNRSLLGDSGLVSETENSLGGDFQKQIAFPADGFIQLASNEKGVPIGIAPLPAFVVAEIQGMGMNPESVFDDPQPLLALAAKMNEDFSKSNTASWDAQSIQPLTDGKFAAAMTDSGMLSALAKSGHQVDVLPLPSFDTNYPASSAQMLGWVVPQKAENPDMAWKLAAAFVADEEMNRFGLRHGLLPVTVQGLYSLEKWADGNMLLPSNVLTLKSLASHSTAWHIPARFASMQCREKFNDFMSKSSDLIAQLADKKATLGDAARTVGEYLANLNGCKP